MKIFASLMAVAGLLILAGAVQASIYTFDADAQGWQQSTVGYYNVSYETLYPNSTAPWTGSYGVGSPDGSIYQSSPGTSWESRPYWMGTKGITAAATLGDLTNKTLQADVRSTANWQGRVSGNTVYARWTIATEGLPGGTSNFWISKAAYSINLNDSAFGSGTDADWVLKSIELKPENFVQWNYLSSGGSFADVLANYTTFGMAILPSASGSDDMANWTGSGTWGSGNTLLHYGATASSGTATWGADNFVPEPATMAFLAVGGIATLLRCRRSSKK
ncbi:MAG: PEP-CTERM sorting domain-containing protein [Planctomycetota bacterium]|nr:PEP-CTERM sorting domain-containing protein [Planctomycetota bacterium]